MAFLAGATAWAETSGGGVQRWAASYLEGAPAFSTSVALSPDGSTVFVTGATAFGPSGRFATLAYDASTGTQKWVSTFPGISSPEWGRGNAIAVSPDGSTVFVTGSSECSGCGEASFEGYSTLAYDASTGDRLWVARNAATGHPYSIAVSPDGSKLFVNGQSQWGEASLTVSYDSSTGEQLWAIEGADENLYWGGGLSVSPDSSTVFVAGTRPGSGAPCFASGGYRTVAYDAVDGTVRWSSPYQVAGEYHCGTATSLGMSPDGSTVFVTGYGGPRDGSGQFGSGTVAYDALTGTQLWARQDDNIRTLDGEVAVSQGVSPDGSKLFVLGDDCAQYPACVFATVAYDASTGDRLWVSRYDGGGRSYARDVAVSADGSAVFVTGQETMPCFDPCTGAQVNAPLVAYDDETGDVRWATTYSDNSGWALAVSPDGSSVYLAGSLTASSSASSAAAADQQHLAGASSSASCSTSACGYSTARYNSRPGPGTFQESQPSVRHDGWQSFFAKTAVGSAYRASHVRGDTATFRTPKARAVTWLTRRGPNQGKTRVTIDGHPKGTFNLYGSTAMARSITFKGLALRAHTVKVRVLGSKDASSKGTWVAVDGFKVRVGSGITHESSAKVDYDTWTGVFSPAASGGSFRMSRSRSARMSLDFTGRTLRWVTATGPSYGRARVVIDGKAHTVDLYRRTRHWRVPISYTGLSKGRHHVTVRPLGAKRASSSSTNVVVDAFVVRS
jgi:hypothetical protein